jgi:hypothetical protein
MGHPIHLSDVTNLCAGCPASRRFCEKWERLRCSRPREHRKLRTAAGGLGLDRRTMFRGGHPMSRKIGETWGTLNHLLCELHGG